MNRGLARRTVFETGQDIRYFLSALARVVRTGQIEVHAYCLLTTHFHLLVSSPGGRLSKAMGQVQNAYVRWFNRGRRRDGALFRGRFRSRLVESLEYRRHLVRYIDFNPVSAGLVPTPALYPHGSARRYAVRGGPPWLSRRWIEDTVKDAAGSRQYEPQNYARCFGAQISDGLVKVVERRLETHHSRSDPLDDLLAGATERVRNWMHRKAALADGTRAGIPVCDAESVHAVLAEARADRPSWPINLSRTRSDAWQLIEVALLRELCAAPWSEIGKRMGLSGEGAVRCYERHRRSLGGEDEYALRLTQSAMAALGRCYTEPGSHTNCSASCATKQSPS